MKISEAKKIIAALTGFVLITFIALELTLRVYMFGLAGLSPARVNSYRNILESGLVHAADNLEVWYELKPGIDELFRGARLITNSSGLADREYPVAKTADTYRVAVIGSSWTMGAGVELEDVFHSVLERDFNEQSTDINYEFISFGVENYGLGEMLGTLRHKALAYQPDMILFIVTGYTPAIRWVQHQKPFVPPPAVDSRWRSYAALRLLSMVGVGGESGSNISALRDSLRSNEYGAYSRQIVRALDELEAIAEENDVAIGTAWIRARASDSERKLAAVVNRRARDRDFAATVIDMEDYLEPGESLHRLLVNRVEKHPNALGHQLIAGTLHREIFGGRLPEPR